MTDKYRTVPASPNLSYQKVDLSGYTAIVTGATSGIGYVTARDLMLMGARVIMACRSPTKAKASMETLQKEVTHAQMEFMSLDLSSLQSVMNFVDEFKKKGYPLQLLICNAAGFFNSKGFTEDNNESSFQVNYLSHFLLTLHLLPVMRESGPDCRIINVSSIGHEYAVFDMENIQAEKDNYISSDFYNTSKLYQVMNMFSLQRRLTNTNVRVFSLHPGIVDTPVLNAFRAEGPAMEKQIQGHYDRGIVMDQEQGAMTTLYVATHPHDKGAIYFSDCAPRDVLPEATSESDQEKLWEYSLQRLQGYITEDLLKDFKQ